MICYNRVLIIIYYTSPLYNIILLSVYTEHVYYDYTYMRARVGPCEARDASTGN